MPVLHMAWGKLWAEKENTRVCGLHVSSSLKSLFFYCINEMIQPINLEFYQVFKEDY